MIQWAGFLINAGLLVIGIIGFVYKMGQLKGVQDQQNERINRLEKRYNGIKGSE